MGKYDYVKINNAARRLQINECRNTFPVNILQLIANLPDVHLVTFQEFNETIALDFGKRAEQISDEAFSCETSTGYVIFYNDDTNFKLPRRIRFTLAHELGHILLGHFDNHKGFLSRNGFDIADPVREKEADIFASELLVPKGLVAIGCSQTEIVDKFDISEDAAYYALKTKTQYPWLRTPAVLRNATFVPKKYFFNAMPQNEFDDKTEWDAKFIPDTYFHYCPQCHYLLILNGIKNKYCTLCGSGDLRIASKSRYLEFHETDEQEAFINLKENPLNMSYTTLRVDDEGRLAQECPRCGNENTRDNFCSVCGVGIINECSGYFADFDVEMDDPCKGALLGADRYCPKCGSQSTFLKHGLLKVWDD